MILIALVSAAIIAVVLKGVTAGLAADSQTAKVITESIEIIGFLGELFIRALKMIIVPLIVTSVVAGIATLRGVEGFARLGLKTVGFYTLTTTLAIFVGLCVVNVIAPGLENGQPSAVIQEAFSQEAAASGNKFNAKIEMASENSERSGLDLIKNLCRQMFPPNVIEAASNNGQMLGLITFSILLALAITKLPEKQGDHLAITFSALNEAVIMITRWIMAVAPIGVFGLILPLVYETGGELFLKLGKYFITVLVALALHFLVVLPVLLFFIAKVNPLDHFRAMRTALLTAFSTASSSATLPLTMRGIQDNAGVSKRVASFTVPLGATVNMDGTALYECVAVIFVAQVMGIELGMVAQLGIVVAALLTSVGVAGIPSASLVAIMLILKSSNIPGAEAAFVALLAVDRPLDMCRTAVNVFGDSCAAAVVAKSEGEELYQQS